MKMRSGSAYLAIIILPALLVWGYEEQQPFDAQRPPSRAGVKSEVFTPGARTDYEDPRTSNVSLQTWKNGLQKELLAELWSDPRRFAPQLEVWTGQVLHEAASVQDAYLDFLIALFDAESQSIDRQESLGNLIIILDQIELIPETQPTHQLIDLLQKTEDMVIQDRIVGILMVLKDPAALPILEERRKVLSQTSQHDDEETSFQKRESLKLTQSALALISTQQY